MILRSITRHVRDQNWFAVGLDFLIVIVGVFIGIQVSNWNEERQNTALADDYRERLTADLITEQALWRSAIDYFETARAYGLQVLEGFDLPPRRLTRVFSLPSTRLARSGTSHPIGRPSTNFSRPVGSRFSRIRT